jgi:hypothetical protein
MSLSLLPSEGQLLFLAAGGSENDAAIRDLLTRDIDWGKLCQLADREYAAPVLWRRMQACGVNGAPVAASDRIRKLARVVHFRMDYVQQRLMESVDALEQAGIECVLLKGVALASTVYWSFTERPMADIDILVPAKRAEEAGRVLLTVGWAAYRGEQPPTNCSEPHHHLLPLLDARGMDVQLEVHRALLPTGHPFAFAADAVWGAAMATARGVRWARVPDPHHLLLHTCIHFAWSHLMRKGAWRAFRDVRAVIDTRAIDWSHFVKLARAAKAGTCCYWTFRLARELMGVEVPTEVLSVLRPPLPEIALAAIERHFTLILFPTRVDCPSVTLRRFMWSAGILPRWSGHGARRRWGIPSATPAPDPTRSSAGSNLRPTRGHWRQYWRGVFLGARNEKVVAFESRTTNV